MRNARWMSLLGVAFLGACGAGNVSGDEAEDGASLTVGGTLNVPGRIEAENYRTGGQNVGYRDDTPGNAGGQYRNDDVDIQKTTDVGGGYNVGWVTAGEYLSYHINVAQAGTYSVTMRMAANTAEAHSLHLMLDGVGMNEHFTLTGGAGWQTWKDVTQTGVSLPAGEHNLRVVFDSDNINLNYFDVKAEGTTPPSPPPPTCTVSDKLVPSCGAWWGFFQRPDWDGGETQAQAFTRAEKWAGRTFDIAHWYHDTTSEFPNAAEKAWSDGGRLLLLNWKPTTTSWSAAASGSIDASVIIPAAQRVKSFGRKMFLDLFHEPENDLGLGTPAEYVAMWKHVRAVFDAQGVTNVVWVWNMMGYYGDADMYTSGEFYPGDTYVDWIAEDPYQGKTTGDFYTFADIVNRTWSARPSYPGFYSLELGHGKPIMLAEWGSKDATDSGTKLGDWFRTVPNAIKTQRPDVKAVVYFGGSGPHGSWEIVSADGQAGFRDAGKDPFVNQKRP